MKRLLLALTLAAAVHAAVPTPEEYFGFKMGADKPEFSTAVATGGSGSKTMLLPPKNRFGMGANTVFETRSISYTEPDAATYTREPFGAIPIAVGKAPMGRAAVTDSNCTTGASSIIRMTEDPADIT